MVGSWSNETSVRELCLARSVSMGPFPYLQGRVGRWATLTMQGAADGDHGKRATGQAESKQVSGGGLRLSKACSWMGMVERSGWLAQNHCWAKRLNEKCRALSLLKRRTGRSRPCKRGPRSRCRCRYRWDVDVDLDFNSGLDWLDWTRRVCWSGPRTRSAAHCCRLLQVELSFFVC